MAHEAQERYSSLVLAKMRSENILKDGIIFNNDYEGDPVAGAVKVPVRDGEVKVGDYDRSAGGDLSESSTEYRSILINREKYVNELVDGYDAASVPDNLIADRLDSAGYSMATALDRDGASTLISQGTRVNVSAISAATVYSDVVDIRTLMSKANVPNDGRRYLLVTPDIYAAMLKSPLFVQASALGDEVKQSGAVGKIAGFTVYEWNDDTANLAMIAGHPRYATRINAWKVPIAVNDLKDSNVYSASYLSDGGYSSSTVTGFQPTITLQGDFMASDPVCAYLDKIQWSPGAARVTDIKMNRNGQIVTCPVTLTQIAIAGGESTAPNAVTVVMAMNGKPTVEDGNLDDTGEKKTGL